MREVVSRCQEDGIPVFPGALTPQEIFDAYNAGATMVKVFPANLFGPAYFKDVLGPFDHVPLLACGGVNAETVAAFFEHGAKGASFGGSIFRREWLTAGDYDRIGEALMSVIRAYQTAVTT
jgi:2-dehydro-3-deoxyphosphogluconate aldolase / (4S)-4-hydroxy-2-oxoglutarate aldolase